VAGRQAWQRTLGLKFMISRISRFREILTSVEGPVALLLWKGASFKSSFDPPTVGMLEAHIQV
jgi:hypothetical protein